MYSWWRVVRVDETRNLPRELGALALHDPRAVSGGRPHIKVCPEFLGPQLGHAWHCNATPYMFSL